MRLLALQERKLTEGDISLTLLPVTKAMQVGYTSVAFATESANDFERGMAITDYILTECIKDLRIAGVEYDPVQVAETANIMDTDTVMTLNKINVMVREHLSGLSEDEAKKSE